ncbi:hypothetical protein Tco_0651059, partial [Tanacetum coccineum]
MVVMMLVKVRCGGEGDSGGLMMATAGESRDDGGRLVEAAMVWHWGWWVMVWPVGDDVGGGGRLLGWPEVARGRRKLGEKREA